MLSESKTGEPDGETQQWWCGRTRGLVIAGLALAALVLTTLHAMRTPSWEIDNAAIFYAGKQFASGRALYKDAMFVKGPLPAMLAGAAIALGRLVGLADLKAAQYAWRGLFAVLAVVGYLWGRRVWRDEWAGLFTAVAFLCFGHLLSMSAVGPRAKVPLLVFMVLLLLAIDHDRWLLAGIAGGLAFACWQPVIVMIALVGVAVLARGKWRGTGLYAAGFVVVQALLVGMFAAQGALRHYLGFAVYLHVCVAERSYILGTPTFARFVETIVGGFPAALFLAVPAAIGVVLWRRRMKWGRWFYPASMVYWIALSLYDMQGPADFYPVLPFVALAAGAGASEIACRLRARAAVCVVAALAVALSAWWANRLIVFRRASIARQESDLRFFREHIGPDEQPLIIGRADLAVRGGWTLASGYLQLLIGEDEAIEWIEPGGFDGWVEQMARKRPKHLIIGRAMGKLTPAFWSWVEANYDPVATRSGPTACGTTLWERKPEPD